MRKQRLFRFLSRVLNRLTVTILIILAQLLWLCLALLQLGESTVWVNALYMLLSVCIVLHLVRKDENPAYTIVWIVLIALVPMLGGMMYLFFGDKRPTKKLRLRMQRTIDDHRYDLARPTGQQLPLPPRAAGLSRYLAQTGPYPAWQHTRTRYYASGEEAFAQLLADLQSAQKFIFLEFFIVATGQMWDAVYRILRSKAAQGVDVRLIFDDFGSMRRLPADFVVQLEKNRIRCLPFNPVVPLLSLVVNHRDHRKLVVVDGNIAYTGGINLADEYINRLRRFGYWKDAALRMEGAAVWNCTVTFLNTWNAFRVTDKLYDRFRPDPAVWRAIPSDGVVQPYADSPLANEDLAERVYLDILAQAERYVYIYTPYFAVGHEMLTALQLAARRGVDVRIVTPGIPDKKLVFRLTRSYYLPLLRAGVRVYEYTPGFLHAKVFACDDSLATVGSVNMDYRSFYLHFECGAVLLGGSQVAAIRADMQRTFAKSREIHTSNCRVGLAGSLLDGVLRLLSPLF